MPICMINYGFGSFDDNTIIRTNMCVKMCRDENGADIFRPYSKPNPFRGVEICPYPSPDIQHPIPYPYPYPYPNTQIAYL